MPKRKPGAGRKHGANSNEVLIRDAIGIALDLLFIDASPAMKGKIARWAAALAEPTMKSLVSIKNDAIRFQLKAPDNFTPERLDVIGKNLRQRLNGTASNASLTFEQGEFVAQSAKGVFLMLASRSLYVSQMFASQMAGWPPNVVLHLKEFALFLHAADPEYASPLAALNDPISRLLRGPAGKWLI